MNDLTIVTAFFDIGRDNWIKEKSLPQYLHRTTETYFERFKYLSTLHNEMFVFTQPEFVERIIKIRAGKTTNIVVFDFPGEFAGLRHRINFVQQHPEYRKLINPAQIHNPEYWSPDYVLVNLLKSYFATIAAKTSKSDMLAWLDFGYCRTPTTLGGIESWSYNFDPAKIHMFYLKQYDGSELTSIISNNDVFITGPCIIAHRDNWTILHNNIFTAVDCLLNQNLIDDDQTFLLIASLTNPELYQLHPVTTGDWFTVFKDFK